MLPSGIEPPTPSLPRTCSTTELRQRLCSGSPSQYNVWPELGKDRSSGFDLDLARAAEHVQGAMSRIKLGPILGKTGANAHEARRQRLATALRENLRKRKAQARERAASDLSPASKPKQP